MNSKLTRLMLCLMLTICIPVCAIAEERATANRYPLELTGTVVAGKMVTARAPFGGVVDDFFIRVGDLLQKGDPLFCLETQKVFAPCDGVVGSLPTRVGDEASYLTEHYGALMFIEPAVQLLIQTNTRNAYDNNENKMIHVGESVFLVSRASSARKGEGIVTGVTNSSYTVEVMEGNLELGESVTIYRNPDLANTSRIGKGTTILNSFIAIQGEGSVFALHVEQGQSVKRGELLMELVSDMVETKNMTNPIVAQEASILASVDVQPGMAVTRGQVLATLYPVDALQVAVNVSQNELHAVKLGDRVRIELIGTDEIEGIIGEIASIAYTSTGEAEPPEFMMYIRFQFAQSVRVGMEAVVYLAEN